jgi:parvulin-like peptidyl-prolyl isomerase
MRQIPFLIVILFALATRAELLNGVNVIVNDSIVTFDEVERDLEPGARVLAQRYPNDLMRFQTELTSNRTDIVRSKVERKLIMDEFKTKMNGGDLPEAVLDDEINYELRKSFNGNRALMTRTLREKGITKEMYRDQQRENMIVRWMRDKNISSDKIIISPAKIETYYAAHQDQFKMGDQVKLRMITINKSAASPDSARKLAEEIIRKIDGGTPFTEMATIYSTGPERTKGGDRGWVGRDSGMRPELVNAMFALKQGQHSDIVELPDSIHILFAEEVKTAHVKPIADVRDEVQQTLRTEEAHRLFDRWMARLKNKAFVRYYE